MSCHHLFRGGAIITGGLLLALTASFAQEITEPLPSTLNPAGSVAPPANADGVIPAEETVPPAIAEPRTPPVRRQATPMTATDLQTWQRIAALHEEFVRSQVGGAAGAAPVTRTDPNRQRLQQLWERLAHIERDLILSDTATTTTATLRTEPGVVVRPLPRKDLDEIPDPLTATNQRVPASEVDEDQHTARAILQEDRSPKANPAVPEVPAVVDPATPLEVVPEAETVRRARPRLDVDVAAGEPRTVVATNPLWQEFIEVYQQILIAEIAAAQAVEEAVPE